MSGRSASPLQWTPERLASLWDYNAAQRPEDFFTRRFGDAILRETRRFYSSDALVCDYGCGPGYLLEKLLRTNRSAACDFSDGNLAEVRRRLGGNGNLVAVFRPDRAPPDLKCDAVYLVETVEHVLPEHEEQLFANLGRLLRPGGVVIATTPHAEDLAANTVYCPECRHEFHRWQHMRSFDAEALSGFFAGRGFHARAAFTVDFAAATPWQRFKSRVRPVLGRKNPHLVYVGRRSG